MRLRARTFWEKWGLGFGNRKLEPANLLTTWNGLDGTRGIKPVPAPLVSLEVQAMLQRLT